MLQERDAVQHVAQFGQQPFHRVGGRRIRVGSCQIREGSAVAIGDRFVHLDVRAVAALGQRRALEQLIRDALKRGDNDDGCEGFDVGQNDPADVSDAIRRGERRTAELEDLHAVEAR
jgi:hypothetical protein